MLCKMCEKAHNFINIKLQNNRILIFNLLNANVIQTIFSETKGTNEKHILENGKGYQVSRYLVFYKIQTHVLSIVSLVSLDLRLEGSAKNL